MSEAPLLLGIAGGTGSGKTTLVRKLQAALGDDICVIQHDEYYRDLSHLAPEQREDRNYDEPDALDNALLVMHLQQLRSGLSVERPIYDFSTHTRRSETVLLRPAPVVCVEGILLLAIGALADLFDLCIFVDTDDDLRVLRRIRRDVLERGRTLESVEQQYLRTVRPMHLLHVAPSKRRAHLVVPEGGENTQALDVIVGRLRHLVGGRGGPA